MSVAWSDMPTASQAWNAKRFMTTSPLDGAYTLHAIHFGTLRVVDRHGTVAAGCFVELEILALTARTV